MKHFGILNEPQEQKLREAMTPIQGGHPQFKEITINELVLHAAKNTDYAAGGKPTGNFDRVAAILALYPKLKPSDPKVVALMYALKQLDAVLWGISENLTQKVEGLKERLGDISVYAKIVMCIVDDEAEEARKIATVEGIVKNAVEAMESDDQRFEDALFFCCPQDGEWNCCRDLPEARAECAAIVTAKRAR